MRIVAYLLWRIPTYPCHKLFSWAWVVVALKLAELVLVFGIVAVVLIAVALGLLAFVVLAVLEQQEHELQAADFCGYAHQPLTVQLPCCPHGIIFRHCFGEFPHL